MSDLDVIEAALKARAVAMNAAETRIALAAVARLREQEAAIPILVNVASTALSVFVPVTEYSGAVGLPGAEAMSALYEWLAGIGHVHTKRGLVTASAIYDSIQVAVAATAVIAEMTPECDCDCHLHENQACDICQGASGRDPVPNRDLPEDRCGGDGTYLPDDPPPDPRDERIRLLEAERDVALAVRDLARDASNRDLEAKREAEATLRLIAVNAESAYWELRRFLDSRPNLTEWVHGDDGPAYPFLAIATMARPKLQERSECQNVLQGHREPSD